MNVCLLCDDGFAMQTGVCLHSIYECNVAFDHINAYIVDNGISNQNKQRLSALAEQFGRDLTFLDVSSALETIRSIKPDENVKYTTSRLRMFLPDLMPREVDRVLVLDSDIIIVDSLEQIWNYDMEGHAVSAVVDGMTKRYGEHIGLMPTSRYFNTGVLLMDLAALRSSDYMERMLDLTKRTSFVDQDAFNVLFEGEFARLPLRFNTITPNRAIPNPESLICFLGMEECEYYSVNEIRSAYELPAVIHYTSGFLGRPWFSNCVDPKRDVWRRHFEASAWHAVSLPPESLNWKRRLTRALWRLLPNAVFARIYRQMRERSVAMFFA